LGKAIRDAIGDNNPMMWHAAWQYRNSADLPRIMAGHADAFVDAVTEAATVTRHDTLERYLTTAATAAAPIIDANPDYTFVSFRFVGFDVAYVYGYKGDSWARILPRAVTDIKRGVPVPYWSDDVVEALRRLGTVAIRFGDADDAGARALWAALDDIRPGSSASDNWKTDVNFSAVVKDIRDRGL
jgi:hypothetical protein